MMWIDTAKKYLSAWVAKDSTAMYNLLSDDICITNWNGVVCGKDNVIEANQQFVNFIDPVKVHIDNTAYHNKYTCLECTITYIPQINVDIHRPNQPIQLHTVYVVEFNDWGKIKAIRIYKT